MRSLTMRVFNPHKLGVLFDSLYIEHSMKLRTGILLPCTILLLGWTFPSGAQDPLFEGPIEDTFEIRLDLFDADTPLYVTLAFDMKRYHRSKMKGEYIPATFSFSVNDSVSIQRSTRIKARGEFRKGYCFYAPFWLNIKGSGLKVGNSENIKRMKVVTQCMRSHSYKNYLMKEYLAYRIFELLTPASFRTRLLRITYVDTGRKNKVTKTWGFIIEPEELLAERVNGVVMEDPFPGMHRMKRESMNLVSVFEYMIGNPDYSIRALHNVKLLGLPGYQSEGYTLVPYDFDYSGFVNTLYAIPDDVLPIKTVTERIYLGPCREQEEYRRTLDYVQEFQEEIMLLVSSFPYLSEAQKKEIRHYLEQYFEQGAKSGLEHIFRNSCR
jgi:hypothetical protein